MNDCFGKLVSTLSRTPCVVALLLWLTSGSSAFSRDWTSTDGKVLSADYVSQDESNVVLKLSATGREVTVPKARLSTADVAYLKSVENFTRTKAFPLDDTGRSKSPWYYVAEADGMFTPESAGRAQWVEDRGRSAEEPPPVTFPVKVKKGVQRFINSSSKERIVVLGTDQMALLEKVYNLPCFEKFKVREQRALLANLAAATLEHGKVTRKAVAKLIAPNKFLVMSAKEQKDLLLAAVRECSPDLNRDFKMSNFQEVETNRRWKRSLRYTAFQIKEPQVAWSNEVTVRGVGRVTIYSLRENDEAGLNVIAKGLSALPPEMVEYLDEVCLHYKGTGFWWGGGRKIYYAANDDLTFNGPLVYVLAHEAGHCIHQQKVKKDWDEALEKGIAFPSAYGLTNHKEDFAEFAAIVTRAWTRPQEMIEIEEVFPWRHKIYTEALGYRRAKSKTAASRN